MFWFTHAYLQLAQFSHLTFECHFEHCGVFGSSQNSVFFHEVNILFRHINKMRRGGYLKNCPLAVITSLEVIIVEYDAIIFSANESARISMITWVIILMQDIRRVEVGSDWLIICTNMGTVINHITHNLLVHAIRLLLLKGHTWDAMFTLHVYMKMGLIILWFY